MLRKLIDRLGSYIAVILTILIVVFSFYTPYTEWRIKNEEAKVFRVQPQKLNSMLELDPPYHNCIFEHQWCSRLAEALVYEARGEGSIGMRAVAYVILERVKHKGWPNTIRGVVEQKYQFSYLQDKHKQSEPTKKDFDLAYKEAYDAVFGISENPVPGAKWYHSDRIKPPKWTKDLEVVKIIGGHIFYKEG